MEKEYYIFNCGPQVAPQVSKLLRDKLDLFVRPLLLQLDQHLDKRLVATFFGLLVSIISFRDRVNGLLLSELGGYLLNPRQAPAGTKRLSNLLRSPKWAASLISAFLWEKAHQHLVQLHQTHQTPLLVWDESVLEKPESLASEGLAPVRSAKAKRLTHYKPGYYRPPSGTVFVPGLHWLGLVLVGLSRESGPPLLVHLRWWTSRGKHPSDKRTEQSELLRECVKRFGRQVIHLWDRGFAGGPWLKEVFKHYGKVRFVMRWPKAYQLLGLDPQVGVVTSAAAQKVYLRAAWEHLRGKRSVAKYQLWDNRRHCNRTVGVVWCEIRHLEHLEQRLWLVASRPGGGMEPWYLLTNEPVYSAEQAWRIILIYGRRWQIEVSWRYCKSELGFESPRLWEWENRLKLLLIATLAYSFLLSLVRESEQRESGLVEWLLRNWCHRTGRHLAQVELPLYRLRQAVSRLWQAHRPVWSVP